MTQDINRSPYRVNSVNHHSPSNSLYGGARERRRRVTMMMLEEEDGVIRACVCVCVRAVANLGDAC